MDDDDFGPFDLLTLREAIRRGSVKVVTWREGKHFPDMEPLKNRMEQLVAGGFLERLSSGGSKRATPGAEFFACYVATPAGRVIIEALERAEAAEAELEQLRAGATPPTA